MKGKLLHACLYILVAFGSNRLLAQTATAIISGPVYVSPGSTATYSVTWIKNSPLPTSTITLTAFGGTIINQNTNPSGSTFCEVLWDNNSGRGWVDVYEDRIGMSAYMYVYVGENLEPGSISTNYPYFSSASSPAIVTVPAAGGFCGINYNYTWQYSSDGIYWTNVGDGEAYPASAPTPTTRTFIRRQVECSEQYKYTNVLEFNYQAANWENRNYIRTNEVWYAGKTTWGQVDMLPIGQKQQNTVYYDGLGRPEQTVVMGASPAGATAQDGKKDLVTPIEYDALGREVKKYLAYQAGTADGKFKPNALADQTSFMGVKYPGESRYYAETVLENSPLNRALTTLAPGQNWGGSGVGIQTGYNLNTSADAVRIWLIDATDVNAIPVSSTVYPDYTLFKKTTTDERGKKIIEYTNIDGQVILKKQQVADVAPALTEAHSGWLCTYYVYDDFGRMRFMITPKAVEQMDTPPTWVISQDMANGLCYRYTYDDKGRLIEKKLPDAATVHMVYDNRDRLVFSQDGNQRAGRTNVNGYKEWTFYLYDPQNRQVASGIMVDNSNYTRSSLQSIIDNTAYQYGQKTFAVPTDVYELVTAFNPVPLFSAAGPVIAHQEVKINTVKHYDEATAAAFNNADLGYADNFENMEPATPSNRNRGLQTGSTARILDQSGTTFLHSKTIYDDKGRVLQTTGQNYLGHDIRYTSQYDFAGKVRSTFYSEIKNLSGGGYDWFKILSKFEQDHVGRLLKINKNITRIYRSTISQPEVVTTTGERNVVENKYDNLGQILSKTLAPGYSNANGNAYLERLIYEYNIRGWMTGINKNYVSSSRSGAFFGMELGYDKPGTAGFSQTVLNGNVAGMAWKTAGDNTPRKYDYKYDNANRLQEAGFTQRNNFDVPNNWTKDQFDFSVPVIQYDANGNITRMEQQGVNFAGIVPMDKMTYGYDVTGNKLQWVAEDINTDYKLSDFTDKNQGAGNIDYSYDENGNLLEDRNKGITAIKYNYLNLPEEITFNNNRGTIRYYYDAAGNKLQKRVYHTALGGATTKTTYSGPIIYGDGSNDMYITFEEGRVRYARNIVPNQQPVFTFDYFIKDNLGNVRMVLTEDTKTDLYPAATMETATATNEDNYYKISNRTDKPIELQNNASYDARYGQKLSKLTTLAGGQKIGPSIVLKVMAGDLVHAKTDYYYKDNGTQVNSTSLLSDLANNLINHLLTGQAGGTAKSQANLIGANAQLDGVVESLITTQDNNYNTSRPKAHLNYIVFDEQFKAVSKGTIQVQNSGPLQPALVKTDIPIDKNGWIYVFVNNESEQSVYFDNFQVTHVRSNILEETHYYPFGLTMKAISPRALSITPINRDKYNGKELQSEEFTDGTGMEAYDYGDRMYDPQTGKWLRQDPLAEEFPNISPYSYAANNPTLYIDKDGKFVNLIMQYGINVGINVAVQMLTAYMFDPKVKSWGDAWDKVSMWNAIWEGATDMIGSKNLRMAVNGVTGIFGYIDQVGFKNITATGLLTSGLMGILEPIVGDAVGKYGANFVKKGLQKLGLDGGTINRLLGINEVNPTFANNTADDLAEGAARRVSKRLQYLGATPGKSSRTGKEVIDRMTREGKIRTTMGAQEFKASDGKWYPLSQADMAHKFDAVTYWNQIGRQFGAKSAEVRSWMLDSNNYYLELFSINRSQGAQLKQTFLDPL